MTLKTKRKLRERVRRAVREWLCGLAGHDDLQRAAPGRLYLECASCGRETPGIEVFDAKNHGRFNDRLKFARLQRVAHVI